MANMSNYLENKLVDFLLRGGSFSAPPTIYIGLCTSSPNDTSTGSNLSEISGGNYARQSLASNTTNWLATNGGNGDTSSGVGGTTYNATEIKWASVTWSGTVSHVALCDSLTGGNVLFYGGLSSSQTVVVGDSISFGSGTLSIQLDN